MKKYRIPLSLLHSIIFAWNRLTAFVLASLLFALATTVQAQEIITTFAGGGPNNIPALEASIGSPVGLTFDVAANLFITAANRVFKVDQSGTLTVAVGNGTYFGSLFSQFLDGGPATDATLYYPSAAAFDATGNLFITDSRNNRIRRVDALTGTISTVAGKGNAFNPGFGGDGGPATQALLNQPTGVAFDTTGNLYISDTGNNRVRKITVDADGRIDGDAGEIITTVAGNGIQGFSGDGGSAIQANLNYPSALTVDASGSLYFVDISNNRIRRVAGGIITTVVGNGNYCTSPDGVQGTAVCLFYPSALAVDAWGNLYFPDRNYVRRVSAGPDNVVTGDDPAEILLTVAGNGTNGSGGDGGPATSASIGTATALAFDANGNLYIGTNSFFVRRVDAGTNGRIDGASDPAEIITRVAGNGFGSFSGDGYPATSARLATPRGVAFDAPRKFFYIADSSNYRVRRVDATTGIITTAAGNGLAGFSGDGGPATAARLYSPTSVAIDGDGNLFITDDQNIRIRRVDAVTGTIITVAGNGIAGFNGDGGLATGASLNRPYGIAVDAHGNLYIADAYNHRIRRVAPGPDGQVTGNDPGEIITTVVGTGPTGTITGSFGGDGEAAYLANLNSPLGVTVDSAGNLFIADTYNNRIRRVEAGADGQVTGTPDEIITTVVGGGTGGWGIPATTALFGYPVATVFDAFGNLFISDGSYRSVVARVDAGGDGQVTGEANEIITFVAGGCCFNGDNIPAASARLFGTVQMAFDSASNLYIADSGNDRIRKVSPSDTTPPEITPNVSGTVGNNGWYRSAVTVTWTVIDPESGIASSTGCGQTVISNDTTGTTITCSATNSAGLSASQQVIIKVDQTAPGINVVTPGAGASYLLGSSVTANYSCSDATSGVASCIGTAPSGSAIDTVSVGTKSFTVTASDNAGNAKTVTATYSVIYNFRGLFAPVDNPPVVNVAKAGSALPVKFSLSGNQGLSIMATGYPRSVVISCDSSAPVDDIEVTVTSGSSGLTYDTTADQYIYTWKTDKAWTGTCRQLQMTLKDGSIYTANFEFK